MRVTAVIEGVVRWFVWCATNEAAPTTIRSKSRTIPALTFVIALTVLVGTFFSHSILAAHGAPPKFLIVDYHPVSKTRVADPSERHPQYDYVYRVDVRNSGPAVADAVGTVKSRRRSIDIIDNTVSFGAVGTNQIKASTDTITVRAGKFFDRRLDRKIFRAPRWEFEEDGHDDEDDRISGLFRRGFHWDLDKLDEIYDLKFSLIFDWAIQGRPATTTPTIANTAPTGLIAESLPTISASYQAAGSAIATTAIVLKVDGVSVTSNATVSPTAISYRPNIALAQGAHNVELTVPNTAGSVASATWAFTIDTQPPSVSGQSPFGTTTASPGAAISAQYTDLGAGIDLTRVQLLLDGQDVTSLTTVTTTGLTYQPALSLADGNHTVVANVRDAAGNAVQSTWSFGVDASGPEVLNLLPLNGSELPADAIPVVAASFGDSGSGINLSSARLELDGQPVTAGLQVSSSGVSYTPSAVLSEGAHAIELSIADANGNATHAQWTFTTRSAPVIINAVPADALLNANSTVVISAQYSDVGSGIDTSKVTLTLDGVDFTTDAQVTAAAITLTPTAALSQGIHIVVLTVADRAGNTSGATWRFTLDTGLPVVSNQQPADTLVNAGAPTISAEFADTGTSSTSTGIAPASIRLLVNNIDVTAQSQIDTTSTPNHIAYTPTQPLTGGLQTMRLSLADKAGNQVESVWSFVVDIEGPAITNLTPAEGALLPVAGSLAVQAEFSDLGSGINATSAVLQLDGVNVPLQATVTATGLTTTLTQSLSEGPHTVSLSIRDLAGNITTRESHFVVASAPQISGQSPLNIFLAPDAHPTLTASFSDIGSGIDTASVRIYFNGVDVTSSAQITTTSVSYVVTQTLADDTHSVRVVVADLAGNISESLWQFATALPPTITATTPIDVILPSGSRPTISASFSDMRVGVDQSSVRMILNGTDVTSAASVTSAGISYTPPAVLAAGAYTVHLQLSNNTNAGATTVWGFEVDALAIYSVAITTPSGSMTVTSPKFSVTATARSNRSHVAELTLNGVKMRSTEDNADGSWSYTGNLELLEGTNALTVRAMFADGEVRTAIGQVAFDGPPRITIQTPADKSTLGRANNTSPQDLTGLVDRPVTITGTLSKPVTSVLINQQAAQLSAGGTAFQFNNFFLREGMNVITAVATDSNGRVGSAAVTVSVDQTAPILSVEAPIASAVTSSGTIDVRGVVNDAVEGMIGAPEPTVTVNGKPALVSDRYYLVSDVPLTIGENTLTVVATDHLGNTRTQALKVSRIAVGSDRLTLLSGNDQRGAIVAELPKALAVIALNADGDPIADLPVTFDVMRGTGTIALAQGQVSTSNGITRARNLVVRTNASGEAQVWLTLGKQTGPGANVVKASNVTLAEDITFVATTERGAVYKVLGDTGLNQFAETGSQPLELLSVVVRDREDNHLPNVPVRFMVEEGDAFFVDGQGVKSRSLVLTTDKNGITATRPTVGSTPGVIRLSAKALKLATGDINNPADLTGNATYLIQAKQAQDGPASFKGYVYDDKGQPLPGIRISIGRTSISSTTDDTGAFEMDNIPPGRIDLFVDGRTSNHQNKVWPSLHFESYVVRGQQNQLPHPIYLPPLLMSEAKVVGGNEDVILTIPGLQGFQMKVKANSVTFPDGSHQGTLVVSPVTADRLPMAPPTGGATFGTPAWTVQPAGTRFDPPIEVRLPNTTAQPPGDNLPVVQWDHDLGQFVPMGRATVSEDGSYSITDAGSGITKAGWGGLCVYDPDKCAKDAAPPECEDCYKFEPDGGECPNGSCVVDPSQDGKLLHSLANSINGRFVLGEWDVYRGRAAVPANFFGEVSLTVNPRGSYKIDTNCCADRGGDAEKISLDGGVTADARFRKNLIPFLAFAESLLPRNVNESLDAGIYVNLSLAGGVTLQGSYTECTDVADGVMTGQLTLDGNVAATVAWPATSFVPRFEVVLATGMVGAIKWTNMKLKRGGARLDGNRQWQLNWYLRGSWQNGTFTATVVDWQVPLIQSDITPFSVNLL